jgi:hypothetical protein
MKRPTLIAAAVLLVLTAAFFVFQSMDSRAPEVPAFSIPAMPDLDKLEVEDKGQKITLARKGGAWRVASPIDFPVAADLSKQLDEALVQGVAMDMSLGQVDAAKYELGPEAPKVTLYAGGQQKAAFRMGKSVTVQPTQAQRSFVQPDGQPQVFRAQASLKELLIRPLADWRERQILGLASPDEVQKLDMTYDGKTVTLTRATDPNAKPAWTSSEGVDVDDLNMGGYLSSLSRLRVADFADDKKSSDVGLDQPVLKLAITAKDGKPRVLLVGPKQGEDQYVRLEDAAWVYKLGPADQRFMEKRMGSLRNLDAVNLDPSKIVGLRFVPQGAAAPVELKKVGGQWEITAPAPSKDVDQDIVNALARTFQNLRALYIAEKGAQAQAVGLTPEKARVIAITLDDGTTRNFKLGDTLPNGDGYVQLDDGEIFALAAFRLQKLIPQQDALIRKPDAMPATPPEQELPPDLLQKLMQQQQELQEKERQKGQGAPH